MKFTNDTTNLLLVELTLRISAIKSLMVKKGLFTEDEFEAEIESIQTKILDTFSSAEKLSLPAVKPPQLN